MRIDGQWYPCDDGAIRPVIRGEVEAQDGSWINVPFLVDTGADRTVLSADILDALQLSPVESPDRLNGVGGAVQSIVANARIRFTNDETQRSRSTVSSQLL
jgi:predicted aspartyl protease